MNGGRIKSFIKKYGIKIAVSVTAFSIAGIAAFAAYTSTQSVKRVVSTNAGAGQLFSSDYMTINENFTRRISFNINNTAPTVNVTVCNYAQGNKTIHFSSSDISYTLKATLVNSKGKPIKTKIEEIEKYTISNITKTNNAPATSFTQQTDGSYTLTLNPEDLKSTVADTHKFSITFPQSQITKSEVFIKLEAQPTTGGLSPLCGIIGVTESMTDATTGWSGRFDDELSDNTSDYYGFNYVIYGSGKDRVTLKWNTKYVEISPIFINEIKEEKNAKSAVDLESGTLSFDVDSARKPQYRLQFYRTGTIPSGENADTVKGYVTFTTSSENTQTEATTVATTVATTEAPTEA